MIDEEFVRSVTVTAFVVVATFVSELVVVCCVLCVVCCLFSSNLCAS